MCFGGEGDDICWGGGFMVLYLVKLSIGWFGGLFFLRFVFVKMGLFVLNLFWLLENIW